MKTKKEMVKFITSFETYPTMNSWNGSYGYSFNVKIHKLPLKEKQRDALYEILETDAFAYEIEEILDQWQDEMKEYGTHTERIEKKINIENMTEKQIQKERERLSGLGWTYDGHGTKIMTLWKDVEKSDFSAGFNGRMSGHLVLYRWNGHNYAGTGWSHELDELSGMSREELKYIYEVLWKFEELYERLLESVRYMADTCKVEDEEYQETKTRKVLVER